jgi:hypothetical protein
MSKGHIFLAQNSDVDYVRQACALALTIKKYNKHNETCLITNDPVPPLYRHAFDHIVPIPWGDSAIGSAWKIENRWKIIHASPFKENIVYELTPYPTKNTALEMLDPEKNTSPMIWLHIWSPLHTNKGKSKVLVFPETVS